MDTYLDLMQGCLQLADVLNASGKRQTDLPMLPKNNSPQWMPIPMLVMHPVPVQAFVNAAT
jgi:hypothetical protein